MPPVITRKEVPAVRRACGNCGTLGHLQRTCMLPEKAHLKVGIEVEGYWLRSGWEAVQNKADSWNMSGVSDGSLGRHADYESYEWRTRPGSLGEAINQLVAIYPDATDAKVGMHVHVSFENSDTSLLATQAFFDYFDAEWRAWGAAKTLSPEHWLYNRLDGNNQYCRKPVASSIPQRHIASMDRYNQLNFASLSQHRTVECRLLPMFRNAALSVSAVEKLIDIYESWLTRGVCETFLSSCTKRTIIDVGESESSRVVKEISLPSDEKVTVNMDMPIYSEPRRLPGYQLLHAGNASRQLTSMGVL